MKKYYILILTKKIRTYWKKSEFVHIIFYNEFGSEKIIENSSLCSHLKKIKT